MLPCPYCGAQSNDFYDFIPAIVQSMIFYNMEYGKFTPDTRPYDSFSEDIQFQVFMILDSLEDDRRKDPALDDETWLDINL